MSEPATFEGEVTGITHAGEGVVRRDGKAVFVPEALPGERVRVTVTDERRRWARGRLDAVLTPHPDRVTPPCPYASQCGGCDLQHVTPTAQRALKTRIVREQLERLGGIPDPPVEDCRGVSAATGYRSRAVLHADADGRLGFHRTGTHEVVPVDRCLVLTDAAQQVREQVGDATGARELAVHGHTRTGRSLAVLRPGPGPLEIPEQPANLLLAQPDGRTVTLRGDAELTEHLAGLTYRFDATSFFQANTEGAEALVAGVLAALGPITGRVVWDLYAGVGLLALPIAAAGARVLAVEGHGPATRYARDNAAEAGLDVEVRHEPVGRLLGRARRGRAGLERVRLDAPDAVVLDPPRTGAGGEVVADLAALGPPRIVYVACDVAALARDVRLLHDAGYVLRRAQPLDLFPMTHHVEVVAVLETVGT